MREDIFLPIYRTQIVPLRFIADHIFHPISMRFFHIGLRYNDKIEWDIDYKWHNIFIEKFSFKLYELFNYPYDWWGTYYSADLSKLDLDLSGDEWNDYDENGHPYWDFIEWHEDPVTGDGWRLKPNAEKLHEILNTESPWENNGNM